MIGVIHLKLKYSLHVIGRKTFAFVRRQTRMCDLHAPVTQMHDAHKNGKHLGSSNLIGRLYAISGSTSGNKGKILD